MPNKELGIADPVYDALRIRSGQSIAPDLGGGSTGAGGIENKIYVWHADGSTIDTFDPDATGLTSALAAAVSGDTMWLPSMTIALTTGITLLAGVMLRGIDTSATISITANNATDYATLTGPASGIAYLSHLTILCTNSGAGDAVALDGAAGQVYAHDCYISGQSTSGAGYGVRSAAGVMTLDDCWVLGSTSPLSGTGTGYLIGAEISTGGIPISNGVGTTVTGLSIGQYYAIEAFNGPVHGDAAYPLLGDYRFEASNDGGSTWSANLGWLDSVGGGGTWILTVPAWGIEVNAINSYYAQLVFQATTTSIKVRFYDTYYGDNTGSLSWRLRAVTAGSGAASNVITHAVRLDPVGGVPAQGDRGVWDALNYPALHTDDTDTITGIHHTLGTGTNQAAAGDHTHGSEATPQTWEIKEPMPVAAADVPAVVYGGKLYAFGGYQASATINLNDTQIYDPVADSWSAGTDMPTARWDAAAAEVGGVVYVFAGAVTNTPTGTNKCEAYDIAGNSWSTKTNVPAGAAQQGLMAVAVGTKIYLFYGTLVYEFDPAGSGGAGSYTAKTAAPVSRTWATCAYVNVGGEDRIYLIGGYGLVGGIQGTDTNYYYRPGSDDWSSAQANAPYESYGQTRDNPVIAGKIYYGFGQHPSDTYFVHLWRYDPSDDSWEHLLDANYERDGLGCAAISGKLYCVGGRKEADAFDYNEVYTPAETGFALFDAATYPELHTNDTDTAAGIHHTLGTGATQSAAGNHAHALTDTHIFVGNGSNVAADVVMSNDATIANTGALTLATVNSNVGSFTNANITVNAKGLITAAANGSGGEVLMADGITPPDPLTTEDETDWLYQG